MSATVSCSGPRRHPVDRVAGPDLALTEHSQVEPRPTVRHEQCRQLRLPQPQSDPVAGDPRLAHLEQGTADLVLISDAHLIVGEPLNREVLTELSVLEVVVAEVLAPVLVGVELVHQDGPVRPAVAGKVALPVPVDVQRADHPSPWGSSLPHSRVNGPPAPLDIAGQPDVDGYQPTHVGCDVCWHPRGRLGGHSGKPRALARQAVSQIVTPLTR